MKKPILVFVAILMLTVSCQKQARDILRTESVLEQINSIKLWETFVPGDADVMPGEINFRLRDNNSISRVAGRITTKFTRTKAMEKGGHNGYYKVLVKRGREKVIAKMLEKYPDVMWAEPNYIVKRLGTPDDTYWNNGTQWDKKHIKADSAWLSGNFGNAEIHIGVTDEGIFPHVDLCANIWRNMEEVNGNAGVDDDQNGYIDDFYGWNFKDNNNQVYMGGDKHGTHVAGIIGMKGGNQIGGIGVMSNVKLISTKFLQGFGSVEDAAKANDYLTDLVTRKNIKLPANNNSWGGGNFSNLYMESVYRSGDVGIIQVYASGNADNNNDVNPQVSFPGAYTNLDETMIAVIATDWQNNKASFSSYGRQRSHIGAPGTGILSTVPTDDHQSGYDLYSGTSMAAPEVTGGIGLYAGIHTSELWLMAPRQRALAIKAALLSSATKLPQLKEYCQGDENGGNFLNVASFIGQTPENPPTNLECPPIVIDNNPPLWPVEGPNFDIYEVGFDTIPGAFYGGYYAVRWRHATDPEGGPVNYILWENDVIFPMLLGGVNWVIAGIDDTSQIIIGKVHGIDTWGNPTAFSNTDTADWSNPPAPDTQAPTLNGNGSTSNITSSSITFSHPAASDNVGVVSYTKHFRPLGGTTWLQRTTGNLSETFSNLQSNTTYQFFYTAKDAAGNVSASSSIVLGTTLPPQSPCTITSALNATSAGLSVTLTFTATSNCEIASNKLERKKNNSSYSVLSNNASSPYNDNVPTPGNYTYRLTTILTNGQTKTVETNIQVKKK